MSGRRSGEKKKEKGRKKNMLGTKNKNLKMPMDIVRKQVFTEQTAQKPSTCVLSPQKAVQPHTKWRFIWIRASSFFTPTVNIQGRTKNELMSNDHHQKGKITTGKGKEAGWMGQEQAYTHECNILQRNLHIPVKKM